MTRTLVLGSLLLAGVLSATVAAFQQAPAQPGRQGGGLQAAPSLEGLTVDKLKDNLYVIRGGGGNTAVFVTADGVTLVDTKIFGWDRTSSRASRKSRASRSRASSTRTRTTITPKAIPTSLPRSRSSLTRTRRS